MSIAQAPEPPKPDPKREEEHLKWVQEKITEHWSYAEHQRRMNDRIQIFLLVLGAVLPALAALSSITFWKALAIVLSIIVVIVTGIERKYRYSETWGLNRMAAVRLTRLKARYLRSNDPDAQPDEKYTFASFYKDTNKTVSDADENWQALRMAKPDSKPPA